MMHSVGYLYIIIWLLVVVVVIGSESISTLDSPAKSSIDSLLQEYAFKALSWPKTKTGTAYNGSVPSNLAGIRISALMLRRDSLKWRGYGYFNEFIIPTGITEEPHVTRIVLVYQNLGNWSSFYYPLHGYTYLTPVLGILAYDAMDMCAKNKPELQVHALEFPINIKFSNVQPAPEGSLIKCFRFYSNNSVEFGNVTNGNECSTRKQGHFGIVAELKIAPSPSPSADGNNNQLSSTVWTISLGFVGFAFLGILYIVAQKFILVERRVVFEDSAAIIFEPLLGAGAAIEQAEVTLPLPLPDEGPSRRLPESDYATRPLPENDYVPQILSNFNQQSDEEDTLPDNDYAPQIFSNFGQQSEEEEEDA
ncbi:uncharacterized protein [Nicotiana tomentosiformis]|uniref:uncharacterized protein n=1 Tax=Nicotiana tomentosiformis TaxID=4098 RepID=UPI00051C0813|nr:uncharacterized protein LOC104092829 [Nicotiana tomentosiformis]